MFMISFYIGCYYNVVLSWAIYYIYSSLTHTLPWTSCDGEWNTECEYRLKLITKFDLAHLHPRKNIVLLNFHGFYQINENFITYVECFPVNISTVNNQV